MTDQDQVSCETAATSGRLDPEDWDAFRALSHRALDGMIDALRSVRDRPVWTEPPPAVRRRFAETLPRSGRPFGEVLDEFEAHILPYGTGNLHPAFMGWVHGSGTPVGMVAEMLAAGLNANCGGRNHVGIEVERQITRWAGELFGFPAGASGLFVTGTSMANFIGLLVARGHALGEGVRRAGLAEGRRLRAYASRAAHGCITRALEMAGLGSDSLRCIPLDRDGAMDAAALAAQVASDRAAGLDPFLVVGTAGTVDTGAIDPLGAIAKIAREEKLWFHVDGAFGALAALAPSLRPLLDGIEQADSIAFDFHKWAHVPYDAGFILMRDGDAHRRTFASVDGYLSRAETGLAAGGTWPCDLGPDLSRGFRALKTWFTIQVHGADKLGRSIEASCALARRLEETMRHSHLFEIMAPVRLNIVCLAPRSPCSDRHSRAIVEHLHNTGVAAPSVTLLDGRAVVRCAINNHRTTAGDIDRFVSDLEQAFQATRDQSNDRRCGGVSPYEAELRHRCIGNALDPGSAAMTR